MFYYWQKEGQDEWREALAAERQRITEKEQPRYSTVLDLDRFITSEMQREDFAEIRYLGPLYFDWDGPDIDTCLTHLRKFVKKLDELEVNLEGVRFYATGGRGFHCEIPMEAFLAKVPAKGVAHLPAIYREMAYELVTDYMDMRVYTARRGRMWRTPNVKRENGRYKVPLTLAEVRDVNADEIETLTATPRHLPQRPTAEFSPKLAVVWAKAEQKVATALKRQRNNTRDQEMLKRFKGQMPPTLKKVMAGEGLRSGAGFNQVVMQIAVTANALGQSEEQVVEACEGLLQNHRGDGRYGSVATRREALREMLRYTHDNVCYSFSAPAIKALLSPEMSGADLDGLPVEAGEVSSSTSSDEGLHQGVFITEKGVYRRTEDGVQKLSNVSYATPSMLFNHENGEVIGFDVEVLLEGKSRGRRLMLNEFFTSKQKILPFVFKEGGVMQGNDCHVVALRGRLSEMAAKTQSIVYCVRKEGFDLVVRPVEGDDPTIYLDRLWVSPDAVHTFATAPTPIHYRYRGDPNPGGFFKSDLMAAPNLADVPEAREVIHALLDMNDPFVIGSFLGWFVSAHHRQIYHRLEGKFPLMQVFGEAGAGKSTTVKTLAHMFYYAAPPRILASQASTPHGLTGAAQSSASIPVIMEEFKPREMRPGFYGQYRSLLRSAYDAQEGVKGAMSDEPGGWRQVGAQGFAAPLLIVGEARETETALVERTVAVPMSKAHAAARAKQADLVHAYRQQVLGPLGKAIVLSTAATDLDAFRASLEQCKAQVRDVAPKGSDFRPMFNIAVVLHGLKFLRQVLAHYYGTEFEEEIQRLYDAVLNTDLQVNISTMSEAAKVVNTLALISNTEPLGSEFELIPNVDYAWYNDYLLDLRLRNCYVKYAAWCRRKGAIPLYDNEDSFISGMSHFNAVVSKKSLDSRLQGSGSMLVYRFDVERLRSQGVEDFRRLSA